MRKTVSPLSLHTQCTHSAHTHCQTSVNFGHKASFRGCVTALSTGGAAGRVAALQAGTKALRLALAGWAPSGSIHRPALAEPTMAAVATSMMAVEAFQCSGRVPRRTRRVTLR